MADLLRDAKFSLAIKGKAVIPHPINPMPGTRT